MSEDYTREMLHYYIFSYKGQCSETGGLASATTIHGMEEKDKIPPSLIDHLKPIAGLNDSAVLVAISYLGHMTKEEVRS